MHVCVRMHVCTCMCVYSECGTEDRIVSSVMMATRSEGFELRQGEARVTPSAKNRSLLWHRVFSLKLEERSREKDFVSAHRVHLSEGVTALGIRDLLCSFA